MAGDRRAGAVTLGTRRDRLQRGLVVVFVVLGPGDVEVAAGRVWGRSRACVCSGDAEELHGCLAVPSLPGLLSYCPVSRVAAGGGSSLPAMFKPEQFSEPSARREAGAVRRWRRWFLRRGSPVPTSGMPARGGGARRAPRAARGRRGSEGSAAPCSG